MVKKEFQSFSYTKEPQMNIHSFDKCFSLVKMNKNNYIELSSPA